jgi:hypothetical protein
MAGLVEPAILISYLGWNRGLAFSACRQIPVSSGRGCQRIAQRARVLARRDCGSYEGRVCCSMDCLSAQSGARATKAAK